MCDDEQNPDQVLKDSIYEEVLEERAYQESKWKGQINSSDDWSAYMAEYALGCSDRTQDKDPRERWVKVAALAFAAIEAYEKSVKR